MANPDRLRKLLAARRTFDVQPLPKTGLLADIAKGNIDGFERAGFYVPDSLAPQLGLPGPVSFYDQTLPNTRGIRRHEVMHGVFRAARNDPALADVVPLWARMRGGSFEDELLARLASRERGAVLEWDTKPYRAKDPIPYAVAEPLLAAARFAAEHPVAAGAMAATAAGTAYGLMASESPTAAIAEDFDRQIARRR